MCSYHYYKDASMKYDDDDKDSGNSGDYNSVDNISINNSSGRRSCNSNGGSNSSSSHYTLIIRLIMMIRY